MRGKLPRQRQEVYANNRTRLPENQMHEGIIDAAECSPECAFRRDLLMG